MNDADVTPGVRRAVRRLLDAVEGALAAARKVEQARDALVREAERLRSLRLAASVAGGEAGGGKG